MPAWDPQHELTADQATRLIAGQFADLAPVRAEPLGAGWDNTAFLVNGRLVFRFPRRDLAGDLLRNETRWLPAIQPHVPLPIPAPLHVGEPAEDYPYPFAGYALIPGVTACRRAWTDASRAGLARPLGRFLRALHGIEIDPGVRALAPADALRRADLPYRIPDLKRRLSSLDAAAPGASVEGLLGLVDSLADAPAHAGPHCWVHGDLYVRHLLVDEAGALMGIIDWGDLHLGDPALDLSLAYSFLPPDARPAFLAEYGAVDDGALMRARFRALHYGAILTAYGASVGDAAIRAAGEWALRSAAAGAD